MQIVSAIVGRLESWELLRGYINARALEEQLGCWLVAVGSSLLSCHLQRRNKKKKLDILTAKIKLAPNQQEVV